MYDEMTNQDFICTLFNKAHPDDDPSSECAVLMDEAGRRISRLEAKVIAWESAAEEWGCSTPGELKWRILSIEHLKGRK